MIREIRELKLDASSRQELSEDKKPLFPCAVYTGEVHSFISQQIPLHWHPDLEMCVLDQGSVRLTLTSGVHVLHAGEGYFINSNIMHGINYNESGPCRYRSIVFDPSILSGAPGSAFDTLYVRPFLEKGPASFLLDGAEWKPALRAFEKNWAACRDEKDGYEFESRAALSAIFLEMKKHSSSVSYSKPAHLQEMRMQAVITWTDEHYGGKVRLIDMADALHISPRECQRLFADTLHCTPMEYLLQKRISAASRMLAESSDTVTEISYRCGFESLSYFTSQFTRVMGISPRRYREKIQTLSKKG